MRTLQFMAVLLLASAVANRVRAQTSLPGDHCLDRSSSSRPTAASPSPPRRRFPAKFVPPGSSEYAPPASIQATPIDNLPPPTYRQPVQSYAGQSSPASTVTALQPEISPNNPDRWRYVNRNGEWWYYTPTKQWMYWSGGRWVEYARPAVSNTSIYVQPPVVSRPRVSVGIGVAPGYYPYGPYPYGPYPYGYGYPYGPYGYGGYGRVGIGIGVGVF